MTVTEANNYIGKEILVSIGDMGPYLESTMILSVSDQAVLLKNNGWIEISSVSFKGLVPTNVNNEGIDSGEQLIEG